MLGSRTGGARLKGSGRMLRGCTGPWRRVRVLLLCSGVLALRCPWHACAAELDEVRGWLLRGRYEDCLRAASQAIAGGRYGEEWRVVKGAAELRTGRYAQAAQTAETALKYYTTSVRLRLLAHEALRLVNRSSEAEVRLREIGELAARAPWRYTDAEDLVALGQAALLAGSDPRAVLEHFFDRARRDDPKHRAPWLASGRLALDKHDYELGAELFRGALQAAPDDPDALSGLAAALRDSDPKQSQAVLERALEINPHHLEALLLRVDGQIDSEDYAGAAHTLEQVLAVNPRQPQAWAYRAVLAHLTGDPRGEAAFRVAALASWRENPQVDHLIGRKLSQKYRFAEGAAYQRRALAFDPRHTPARVQLSQDLLRLGEEEQGWQLAEAVHAQDGYDVATFNLLQLRDELARFRTLENDDFIVRMEAHEADVYGRQVLDVLGRAKRVLCAKYGLALDEKITVEIFPDPNDFAVRTFGLPAVSGYLGVCFGKVITANSPASQGERPSNWQAVLWHEFCHVVTLELTRNRMPRWLSEGISVYEERQANPGWGQRMNPRFRQMVLDGELTPIGRLSSVFLSPKSALHVQFAYFQSALVVEFLVETYGLDTLRRILRDLADGLPINAALERHTKGLEQLEAEFAESVRQQAQQLAPEVDFTQPDVPALLTSDGDALAEFLAEHPRNFAALSARADVLIQQQRWDEAQAALRRMIELYPGYNGADNAYERLARVHRELGQWSDERAVLEAYVAIDADALAACLRLLELQSAAGDAGAVLQTAERAAAIHPLLEPIYRHAARAAEQLGRHEQAIAACETLLKLDPHDPARVHYQLACLLADRDRAGAKRHVLQALEEAPRFREAHRLLLRLHRTAD